MVGVLLVCPRIIGCPVSKVPKKADRNHLLMVPQKEPTFALENVFALEVGEVGHMYSLCPLDQNSITLLINLSVHLLYAESTALVSFPLVTTVPGP